MPRGTTRIGLSLRPRQAEAMGLDPATTFAALLAHPFHVVRLGAYWSRLEPSPGRFCPEELDWQLDAAERAGKQVVLCVGAVKTFGYPEFFVPVHHLPRPLREGALVRPGTSPLLLAAATEHVQRVVERYRGRAAVVAWQVEHDAVDPLGMDHSWRLAAGFVEAEVAAVRRADPSRPVVLNGFLPASLPVRLHQWWRTRDQGDSLALAARLADVVGIDYYPRHALVAAGPLTLYLDGAGRRQPPWPFAWAAARCRRLLVSEGQAEPWEAVTRPPSPPGRVMSSCTPEHVIGNYNRCVGWSRQSGAELDAYLFWGAEYWMLRQRTGDERYLRAFLRVLEES